MTDGEFITSLNNHASGPQFRMLIALAASTPAELLRVVMRAEAEGEASIGREAVGWVFYWRSQHPWWWGSTIMQCCLWPAQVSSFWADYPKRAAAIQSELYNPTPNIEQDAELLYDSIMNSRFSDDPTGGATYYWNPDVCNPAWASRVTWTRKIGHHQFAVDESEVPR